MSDETAVRKFVKPAHADARIPDPHHPGLSLPAEGASVPWDHYWIARERQGDVVIADEAEAEKKPDATPVLPEPPAPAVPAAAGVPFMITKAQREQLAERGFTTEDIAHTTPVAAQTELQKPAVQAD